MKWTIILLLGAVLLAQNSTDNFPVIRRMQTEFYYDLIVRKIEDGPNTCYITYQNDGRGAVSISCVKR
jgi:hypothetical protein